MRKESARRLGIPGDSSMNTSPAVERRRRAGATRPEPQAVLTRAVLRAAELLGLSNAVLARVLGISEASVSRMAAGSRLVNPSSKEGELALLLVRAYRSLDALVGADDAQRRAWMGHNHALAGAPIDLIQRADGLVAVVAYLDGVRRWRDVGGDRRVAVRRGVVPKRRARSQRSAVARGRSAARHREHETGGQRRRAAVARGTA